MWHDSWGGLPGQDFLSAISPALDGIRDRMFTEVYTADQAAGQLTQKWAETLGLPAGIIIAIGEFDCHMGAVGAGAGKYDLVKVIGTSTCDILMVDESDIGDRTIHGICGQVKGSATPDLMALEAGQSAFGDIYAWYKRLLMWPIQQYAKQNPDADIPVAELDDMLIPMLTEASCATSEDSAIAMDWHNGRRTPYANQRLKGAIAELNLGSDAPELFSALVESTAHGAKAIADSFVEQGVKVERVVAIGGISKKSPFVMQTCADVLGRDIVVAESEQSCALGAAIFAAVAAGEYDNTQQAQAVMASPVNRTYQPNAGVADIRRKRANVYSHLGQQIEGLSEYKLSQERLIMNVNSSVLTNSAVTDSELNQRLTDLRHQVWQANMALREHNLVTFTWGNVSGIDRVSGLVVIKPSGVSYEELSADNMVVVDLDGKVIEGEMKPSSDTATHVALYHKYPDIGGVVHTHSPNATSWAQAGCTIPALGTTHADYFYGSIPCTRALTNEEIATDYEANTGAVIIETIGEDNPMEKPGIIVKEHGPFSWGKDPDNAVHNAVVMEVVGGMALQTLQINPQVSFINQALLDKHYLRKHGANAYYGQSKSE